MTCQQGYEDDKDCKPGCGQVFQYGIEMLCEKVPDGLEIARKEKVVDQIYFQRMFPDVLQKLADTVFFTKIGVLSEKKKNDH